MAVCLGIVMLASACGGGDPLPAAGPEPPPGGVRVQAVEPAGRDDAGLWLTREARVVVRGDAPAGATVVALRHGDGSEVARAQAAPDGRFEIDGLPLDDGPAFDLQARLPGRPPGPSTPLMVVRRTSPPTPFVVDPVDPDTNALTVRLRGTTEADAVVIVGVEGGAARMETRKPAGRAEFAVDVPLDRDRTHRLSVTATDLAGNRAGPIVRSVRQDSTAPAPPSAPPRAVSADHTALHGQAPGAVSVELETPADGRLSVAVEGGAFTAEVSLPAEGENVFGAIAADAAGNRSEPARLVIVRDTVAPATPEVSVEGGTVVEGIVFVSDRTVTLTGRAEPEATVEASGEGLFGTAVAGTDGGFRLQVTLPWPFVAVPIAVEAVDAAGNRSTAVHLRVAALGGADGTEGGRR